MWITITGLGVEPKFPGYEPSDLPLVHPANSADILSGLLCRVLLEPRLPVLRLQPRLMQLCFYFVCRCCEICLEEHVELLHSNV